MPNHRQGWIKPFASRIKGKYHINEDGCWHWHGAVNGDGYPVVGSYKQNLRVTRLMMKGYGPVPDWLGVLHSCFNKRCINPAHLRLGTDAENHRDKDFAKLTRKQVDYIRFSSKTNRELADELPVGIRQVWMIKRGDSWA
jgi:hypothetical protein